jgi:hypothetical protein
MKQELAALPSADASNDWVLDGKELEYLKRLGSGTPHTYCSCDPRLLIALTGLRFH